MSVLQTVKSMTQQANVDAHLARAAGQPGSRLGDGMELLMNGVGAAFPPLGALIHLANGLTFGLLSFGELEDAHRQAIRTYAARELGLAGVGLTPLGGAVYGAAALIAAAELVGPSGA